MMFLTTSAFCYEMTSQELKNTIQEKIDFSIKKNYKNISQDIEISITTPFSSIITEEKPIIEIDKNPHFVKNIAYYKVYLKNSKENIIKTFNTVAKIKIYKNVLVASENINFGNEINSNNTIIEKREISAILNNIFSELNENLISNANIKKGDIILINKIKQKPLILKNSTIDVVFNSNNLKIKIQARALEDGVKNKKIAVRSDKYNKVYTGIVISKNEVMVGN